MTRPAIGPGAAAAAWLAVLVVLNLTGDPVTCAISFGALAVLAVRTDQRRLLMLSMLVGLGLLLVVPGVALVDGSFELSFAASGPPVGVVGWLASIAAGLRVPAQVLAAAFLVLVPARLLLDGAARVSPDTALLGALAARMHPLLARDAGLVRDELASRGLRVSHDAPATERIRAARALWEAVVAGMLDRAFVTAAALDARGWGVTRPTSDELQHPELREPWTRSRPLERLLVTVSAVLVVGAVVARSSGALAGPMPGLVAPVDQIGAPVAWLLGIGIALLAAVAAVAPSRRALQPRDAGERSTAAARAHPHGQRLDVVDAGMRYPGANAPSLEAASIHVEPGELVVIAGPSGGGKSTLLDVITGVAPRTTGGVRNGIVRLGDVVFDAAQPSSGGRVAAVFQQPELQVLVGRVAEEVAFGLRHRGVARAELEHRVLDVLDQLDIRHLAGRDCSTLSGGELQRVLLAAALVTEPALLVLDEPTSQVDAATERRFWDAVDHVRRTRRIGVLVAEHRLDALLHRADRVVLVADGRIVATHAPADAAAQLPQLLANPYAGLVPAPARIEAPPRLVVRIDRLTVGGDGAAAGTTLLRGLSIAAPAGSIITLEGPNGTGKSTLLRAVRGLHGGALVEVDGRVRGDVGSSASLVAWLSQGAGAMLPGRTVGDAAAETSRRLGVGDAAACAALDAAGLSARAAAHPTQLSVGERQRLALVAATAHRPPIWLLDEPTRGMDSSSRRWVACHALAHAAAGGIVIVATHDPQLAAAIATHRMRLDLRTGPDLVPVVRDAAGLPSTSVPTTRALDPVDAAEVDA